jgi:hypothetical protein
MIFHVDSEEKQKQIHDLTMQVGAAELHLTHFASQYDKASPQYQESLRDFATVWFLLKQNRQDTEFHKEVLAS